MTLEDLNFTGISYFQGKYVMSGLSLPIFIEDWFNRFYVPRVVTSDPEVFTILNSLKDDLKKSFEAEFGPKNVDPDSRTFDLGFIYVHFIARNAIRWADSFDDNYPYLTFVTSISGELSEFIRLSYIEQSHKIFNLVAPASDV